ncbi:phosphonate ABC transporter, permease protein PhnE [Phytoactinopolyspora halotolerans]|uniref:Phosphonate ABC transporter, permease protein PhnE n=1 Tax=Phytoactinopolyspora halotolerans TaxID=1981512 RepID=A0A6L9S509_9ACTN|nr:phosphonate ABC transporter, permease protein PhnE [Phytoactinopolyspora halotolerans]NEE00555.1 phosphonate ABC transporter, permease protein PhnE [Phytoactinopolyspora halotolerans]
MTGAQQTRRAADERLRRAVRPEKPFNWFRLVVTVAVVAGFLLATSTVDAHWGRLPEAPAQLWNILGLMIGELALADLPDALASMWESVAIAWLGTMIAAVLSFPLAFLAARNIAGPGTVVVTRQLLNIPRAIPEIIFAVALIPIFGLGPLAGTVAIGLSSTGTIGKLSAEIIEGCERGPIEAADAAGASKPQRVRWAVIPQVMPEIVAFWLYRFEINIRASAVLGVVGAGGIGTMLQQSIEFRQWGQAGMALIVVIVVTIVIDAASGAIRRRIIRGPSS